MFVCGNVNEILDRQKLNITKIARQRIWKIYNCFIFFTFYNILYSYSDFMYHGDIIVKNI